METIPGWMHILFIKELLSSIGVVLFHSYYIKLFSLVLLNTTIMHPISHNLLFFLIVLHISSSILIFNKVFHLVSFLRVHPLLINSLQILRQVIWWWQFTFIIFPMLLFLNFSLLLKILLFLLVIEFAENWIIVVCFPILI